MRADAGLVSAVRSAHALPDARSEKRWWSDARTVNGRGSQEPGQGRFITPVMTTSF